MLPRTEVRAPCVQIHECGMCVRFTEGTELHGCAVLTSRVVTSISASHRALTPKQFARLTTIAVVMQCVIVVTGALVRLTGSGLGCTNWPNCTETALVPPLGIHGVIEFGNRVFSLFVGLSAVAVFVGAWYRRPRRRDYLVLSGALVLGVVTQAVIGGITVRTGLSPEWTMTHFLLSMLLIWAAMVLASRAHQPDSPPHAIVHRDYIMLARSVVLVSIVVLVMGTIVTGSGPNGGDVDAPRFAFGLHESAKAHAFVVWLLIALTVTLTIQLRRAGASSTLVRRCVYVLGALGVQGAIGYVQYLINVPPALAIFHVAGSVLLWMSVLWMYFGMHERYGEIGLDVYDETETSVFSHSVDGIDTKE